MVEQVYFSENLQLNNPDRSYQRIGNRTEEFRHENTKGEVG
jgi:hypothetical protein